MSTHNNKPAQAPIPWAPFGLIAVAVVWVVAAISCLIQKQRADKLISDSFDISAIQIQQLNGQVSAHVLLVLVFALGITAVVGLGLATSSRSKSALADSQIISELRAARATMSGASNGTATAAQHEISI